MGVEGMLSERNLRQAETAMGEKLLFAVATHDSWIVGVTPDDRHIGWHRRTAEVEPFEVDVHFVSCPSNGGPTERRTRGGG